MNIYKKFFFIFLLIQFSSGIYAQDHLFQFEGRYQGENVFIQNPLSDSSGKYCTKSITINQIKILSGFESSAYEIRLDTLNLKLGDTVMVSIYHQPDCKPKIINAMINPRPTYEVRKISIDTSGLLKWTTEMEKGSLTFTIEQFYWNKWISVGEMDGKGNEFLNEYEFTATFHSGKNKFRVKQTDGNGKNYLSKQVEIDSGIKPVKLKSNNFNKSIDFGRITRYEIYDAQGNLLKKGFEQIIDTSDLPKGMYYVNYDVEQAEMTKR
jgi:hypothetical protein